MAAALVDGTDYTATFDGVPNCTLTLNFLTADAPDVTSWYPGNLMAPFVDAGLFQPVDDVWADNGFN